MSSLISNAKSFSDLVNQASTLPCTITDVKSVKSVVIEATGDTKEASEILRLFLKMFKILQLYLVVN
jgi:hypothetical protein